MTGTQFQKQEGNNLLDEPQNEIENIVAARHFGGNRIPFHLDSERKMGCAPDGGRGTSGKRGDDGMPIETRADT